MAAGDRTYAGMVRRQTRHAELAAGAADNPRLRVDEEVRYLRSLLAMITRSDYGASPEVAGTISACSANLTGLMMGRLMDQEA